MKLIKSIETKNICLQLLTEKEYYFVHEDGKKVCQTKLLDAALSYFDIAYNQFLKRNN